MMRQNRSVQGGGCMTFIGIILLIAAIAAAVFGLIAGILTLTGNSASTGIMVMVLFIAPLWLYLLIKGLRDLKRKTAKSKWFKLTAAGLLVVVIAGISILYSVYLGKCDQRLVAGSRLIGCNFSGHDLHGLDLHGADLTYANLSGANLTGVNLLGARFEQTDLTGALGLTDNSLAGFLGVKVEDLPQATSLKQIRLESRTKIQQTLLIVCTSRGVEDARYYSDNPSFHTVMVLDSDGKPSSAWGNGLMGNGWEPMALRFTDLVACVGKQEKVGVQTCHYTGGSTVNRYRYEVKIRLLEAATGRQVAEETIQGSDPDSCPSTVQHGGATITGKKVSDSNISDWLAKWVHPPVK
jgi:uncharacterized protein YjbI with pentapeptide repeats